MSQRSPPKSKTTARTLFRGVAPLVFVRRLQSHLHRSGRVLVGRERDPAALFQAILVHHLVLRAGGLITLEVCHRVADARLVPLLFRVRGARGEREKTRCEEEHPSSHDAHDTMRAHMLKTTIAGSLPKPAWLAKPESLWAPWLLDGSALAQGKEDAVMLALRDQEDAGIDIVTDGEQTRRHFVWGFVEQIDGIDFARMVTIGIRADRYRADVPTVVGPLSRRGSIHGDEARFARAHTRRPLKWTMPGPMTVVDTIYAAHYRSRERLGLEVARLLNEEARELEALGVDVIQFDEPAFNVYMDEVRDWGIAALDRAVEGLSCRTAVHICYGYGIKANIDWKKTLGGEWRQYEQTFPQLARSRIGGVSIECANSRVPMSLIGLLDGKDVLVGAIDVATSEVETPTQVAAVIRAALEHVKPEHLHPCTNCGMVPLPRGVARAKLRALGAGAELVRRELSR